MLSRTTKLCRCDVTYTSELRTCHAVTKGMLPGHSAQGKFKGLNDRRDTGRHAAGGGSDKRCISSSQGQSQGARHGPSMSACSMASTVKALEKFDMPPQAASVTCSGQPLSARRPV
jgi:hypothetical protein